MSSNSRRFGPAGILAIVAAVLSTAGACSKGPGDAWTGPGWYLEMPYPVIGGGPSVQGGPYSYDDCEAERGKRPPQSTERLLCVNETKQPPKFGFY